MNNTDRERIIREAIAARQAEGWTIRSRTTRDSDRKECCPLGAIAYGTLRETGFKYLGVGTFWIGSFITAVDSGERFGDYDREAYALGLKFKEEFGL